MSPIAGKKTRQILQIEKSLAYVEHLTKDLSSIIEKETHSLENYHMDKFMQYQGDKARLVKNFEIEAQKLLAVREKIKEADPAIRKKIRDTQMAFMNLTKENATMLKRRLESTRRLNERIMNSARQALTDKDQTYNNMGSHITVDKKTLSSGLLDTI